MSDQSLRDKILAEQINIIEHDINIWRGFEISTNIIGEIFSGVSAILAFSVGYFNIPLLGYLAGAFGVSSIGLRKFSTYCLQQGQAQNIVINNLLKADGQGTIPDVLNK